MQYGILSVIYLDTIVQAATDNSFCAVICVLEEERLMPSLGRLE